MGMTSGQPSPVLRDFLRKLDCIRQRNKVQTDIDSGLHVFRALLLLAVLWSV